ncbi:hypothetical protein J6590_015959 [Homalodisca vitripennis]|nr:hypothetical protein J6590_015959 [Homalodisca vitripennis]
MNNVVRYVTLGLSGMPRIITKTTPVQVVRYVTLGLSGMPRSITKTTPVQVVRYVTLWRSVTYSVGEPTTQRDYNHRARTSSRTFSRGTNNTTRLQPQSQNTFTHIQSGNQQHNAITTTEPEHLHAHSVGEPTTQRDYNHRARRPSRTFSRGTNNTTRLQPQSQNTFTHIQSGNQQHNAITTTDRTPSRTFSRGTNNTKRLQPQSQNIFTHIQSGNQQHNAITTTEPEDLHAHSVGEPTTQSDYNHRARIPSRTFSRGTNNTKRLQPQSQNTFTHIQSGNQQHNAITRTEPEHLYARFSACVELSQGHHRYLTYQWRVAQLTCAAL